jgi:hypothetical protein
LHCIWHARTHIYWTPACWSLEEGGISNQPALFDDSLEMNLEGPLDACSNGLRGNAHKTIISTAVCQHAFPDLPASQFFAAYRASLPDNPRPGRDLITGEETVNALNVIICPFIQRYIGGPLRLLVAETVSGYAQELLTLFHGEMDGITDPEKKIDKRAKRLSDLEVRKLRVLRPKLLVSL